MDLNSLPLDVLLYILEVRNDVDLVKNCRLISRSWNEVCCRVLRKIAGVPLKENGEGLERFKDVLLDRQFHFPPDWPTPFRNYKLLEASFSTPSYIRFIQRPILRITSMDVMIHNKNKFQLPIFEHVLEEHKGSIRKLKIRDNCGSVSFVMGKGGETLTSVTLKDTCKDSRLTCPLVDLSIRIIAEKSILEIDLDGDLTQTTKIFSQNQNQGCWDALFRLKLTSDTPPETATPGEIEGFMKWAQELKFPALTKFSVWFSVDRTPHQTLERYTPYLLPLIQESFGTLEELQSTFLRLGSLPGCPKLKYLGCALGDGDRIQDLTRSKFPSVMVISSYVYWTQVPVYSKIELDESILKSVTFTIFWWKTTPQAPVETLWWSLGSQYQNLKKLIIIPKITFTTLNSIRRRLPSLTDVEIREISAPELLGTASVLSTREKGWDCEHIDNCPIMEIKGLTHVRLGAHVFISEEVVACLAKLPKIKFFSFYWNNTLPAAAVVQHLRRVRTVRIFYKSTDAVQVLQMLAVTRSNLELIEQP